MALLSLERWNEWFHRIFSLSIFKSPLTVEKTVNDQLLKLLYTEKGSGLFAIKLTNKEAEKKKYNDKFVEHFVN